MDTIATARVLHAYPAVQAIDAATRDEVFAARMTDLMALIEAVAFQRLDQRLAAALLGHGAEVHATHQALADRLGTAREIVTRLLQRFERAGHVRLGRERIDIVDAAALRALAAPDAEPSTGASRR